MSEPVRDAIGIVAAAVRKKAEDMASHVPKYEEWTVGQYAEHEIAAALLDIAEDLERKLETW